MRRGLLALLPAVVVAAVLPTPAQMPVPMEVQAPIVARILAYDRSLARRAGGEIVLGLLYQERVRESVVAKNEGLAHLGGATAGRVGQVPLRVVAIPMQDVADIADLVRRHGIHVVYVAPLRGVLIAELVEQTRMAGAITVTGVPEYVEGGVAVGIFEQGGRPAILVNLGASRLEGSEYRAEFLRLAHVIGGEGGR